LTPDPTTFLSHCVSVDLEVDPKSARLFAFAAVRGDRAVVYKGAVSDAALDRLEALCDGAAHLVGHNILRHDLPHLVANRARLAGLGAAAIDTLWLNPLAFPCNPYHHLVKHYQDGRLQVGHVNDPEQDARLALQVLADQGQGLARISAAVTCLPAHPSALGHVTQQRARLGIGQAPSAEQVDGCACKGCHLLVHDGRKVRSGRRWANSCELLSALLLGVRHTFCAIWQDRISSAHIAVA
jgi:hypothetical protein